MGWLVLILTAVPSTTGAFEPVGGLHATGGIRWFDGRSLDDETRAQLGGSAFFGGGSWPLVPSVYYTKTDGQFTTDTDQDPNTFDYTATELGIGVMRVWGLARVRPYVSGGWARSRTTTFHPWFDTESTTERDRMWLGAGALYRVGSILDLGLGGRFGTEVTEWNDVGTWSAFAILGLGFPLE